MTLPSPAMADEDGPAWRGRQPRSESSTPAPQPQPQPRNQSRAEPLRADKPWSQRSVEARAQASGQGYARSRVDARGDAGRVPGSRPEQARPDRVPGTSPNWTPPTDRQRPQAGNGQWSRDGQWGRDGDRRPDGNGQWNRDGDRRPDRDGQWNRNGDRRPDRDGQWNRQNDRRPDRDKPWSRDNDRRWDDNDGRRWNRDWRHDNRYNWSRYREANRERYRVGRYHAPYSGYAYRRLSVGLRLGPLFYGNRYWINDPWSYRLPDVYGPYRWVRYYDDAVLVDVYSGQVVDVIYDFFW